MRLTKTQETVKNLLQTIEHFENPISLNDSWIKELKAALEFDLQRPTSEDYFEKEIEDKNLTIKRLTESYHQLRSNHRNSEQAFVNMKARCESAEHNLNEAHKNNQILFDKNSNLREDCRHMKECHQARVNELDVCEKNRLGHMKKIQSLEKEIMDLKAKKGDNWVSDYWIQHEKIQKLELELMNAEKLAKERLEIIQKLVFDSLPDKTLKLKDYLPKAPWRKQDRVNFDFTPNPWGFKKTKTVWQWRCCLESRWTINSRLMTEDEAQQNYNRIPKFLFEKHAGPFEVPV